MSFFFFIARVLPFSMTPHYSPGTGLDPPEQPTALGELRDAKRPKFLSTKHFFPQSNPHSDQKHRNFTDRWVVIFCFINENGRWPRLSEMFE
jgi:hypothetical protein